MTNSTVRRPGIGGRWAGTVSDSPGSRALTFALFALAALAVAAIAISAVRLVQIGRPAAELSFAERPAGQTSFVAAGLAASTRYVICGDTGAAAELFEVTGPDGVVAVSEPRSTVQVTVNDTTFSPEATFTTTRPGDYTVTMHQQLSAGSQAALRVAPYGPFEQFGRSIAGLITGVFIGIAAIVAGGWLSHARRRARHAAAMT